MGSTDHSIQRVGKRALQPSSKLDTSFLPMERTLVQPRGNWQKCRTCMSYGKNLKTQETMYIFHIYIIYIFNVYSDWYNLMIPSCHISYVLLDHVRALAKKTMVSSKFECPDLPNLGHNEFLQLGAHAGQIFGWSLAGCNRPAGNWPAGHSGPNTPIGLCKYHSVGCCC